MLCLAPVETRMFSALSFMSWTADSSAAAAARSSAMPATAVYLPAPCSMAAAAAVWMCAGVSKSGSPAPRPMTFSPFACSSRAFSNASDDSSN